ncbi:hypothetical protein GH714_010728 [Hevea brasiliensis]|uniref:SREBP regulating gene protein n=1 Tax=Hevea brasiliensis TaxID=3981 RepID=A0A6A6LFK4_HEVBR|nr:hypothetical protein GH714_010728 [Hevea brasiliensis]
MYVMLYRWIHSPAAVLRKERNSLVRTYAGIFDFCAGRCRHNSESVVHENAYLSDFHHCYSLSSNSSGANYTEQEARLVGINVVIGRQGESCHSACKSNGQSCVLNKLLVLNHCDVMQKYMSCNGTCLASIGADQPAELLTMLLNTWNILSGQHLSMVAIRLCMVRMVKNAIEELCPSKGICQRQVSFRSVIIELPDEFIRERSVVVLHNLRIKLFHPLEEKLEKKTYPRFCVASPAKTMRRRRVSSSAWRRFWVERCWRRRSREKVWEAEGVMEVVGEIEKVVVVEEEEDMEREREVFVAVEMDVRGLRKREEVGWESECWSLRREWWWWWWCGGIGGVGGHLKEMEKRGEVRRSLR